MDPITMREMITADIPRVAGLHVDSWQRHYAGILPADFLDALDIKRCEQQWQQRLADSTRNTFERVVLHDCRLAGFAMGQPASGDDGCHELRSFYTDTTRGFAVLPAVFMRHMISSLASLKPERLIQLWVLRDNRRARDFFEAVGFHADGATRKAALGTTEAMLVSYRIDCHDPGRVARQGHRR